MLFSVLTPIAPAFAQPATSQNVVGTAHVKVAHFAPFANTIDGTAVIVTVDYLPVGVFKFGDITPAYVDLPAGSHHVEVAYAGGGGVPVSTDINLVADTFYTISMIGNGTLQPLELLQQVDDTVAPAAGAKVRFTHLAPIAADINNTKIDICTSDNVVVPGLAGIAYKTFNDPYLTLLPGDYKLKIAQAGTSCAVVLLDLPSTRFANGQILDLYAIGDIVDQPLAVTSTTGITLTPFAHVKFGHFAPFANTIPGTAVTIEVNGVPVISDFKFGDITPVYFDLPAETDLLVKVFPSGDISPIITQTLNFTTNTFYTIAVIGNGSVPYPLEVDPLIDDVTRPTTGAKVRVADFAALPIATSFDICTTDYVVVSGLSGLGYKDVTGYLTLPAGIYNLMITLAGSGCMIKLYDVPPLTLINYTVVTTFAIGDVTHLPAEVVLRWEQSPILAFMPVIKK
jgi:hypothetical protein